jgi:ABC-type protease/lipase transport system fused ATPase/permease subunit
LALPPPETSFAAEHLTLAPPGAQRPTVIDVDFALNAGDAVSVIGPSASGKSSLARGLVGVWPAVQGKVRLDGAALDQWAPDALGRHIGYLPQNVLLIDGTIAQNIARFDEDATDESVIAAARAAGVHDLILRLPRGYATPVGSDGTSLSAGQRQRVALARALYRDPFFVVLDEPNSNLDTEGELALVEAIRGVRQRRGIVVVIAHRPGVLDAVDLLLVMQEGRVRAFGPKTEILQKIMPPRPTIVPAPTQAQA